MPSLSALNEFKSSFDNIASVDMPYVDLPLPETEAPPFEPIRRVADQSEVSEADDLFPSDQDEEDTSFSGGGDFDFSAFIDTLPGDIAPPPIDEVLSDEETSEDAASNGIFDDGMFEDKTTGDETSEDNIFQDMDLPSNGDTSSVDEEASFNEGLPEGGETSSFDDLFTAAPPEDADLPSSGTTMDDLLSGFSDETETAPQDFGTEDSGLSDFDFPETESSGVSADETPVDEPPADFDFSGMGLDETPAEESPLDDMSVDLSGIESSDDGALDDDAGETFDLGGERQDGAFVTEGASPDAGISEDFSPMDLYADVSEDSVVSQSALDALDALENAQGDEPSTDDISADGISDDAFDLGGGVMDLGGEVADGSFDTGSDFDGTLPDMNFPETEASDDASSGADFDLDSFMNGVSADASASGEESPLAGLDLGADFDSDSIELTSEPGAAVQTDDSTPSESFGDDEFDLPDLGEIFEKTGIDAKPKAPPKRGLFGRRKKAEAEEIPQASDDVEELQLTQEDLEKLLETLSSYPLNLRIACEEMIAEQVLTPQQLSKLVRLLVNGAHVKETAAHAEEVTGKEIVIPKSFQKSTGAALADEQASFAYIFVHNFLPVLRLVAVIGALLVSVIYLGYKFIYLPAKAESLYKRGYERIYAGEYQRANELFHEASETHRKKKWFYQYAEGFRDERRYLLAEGKYDELLRYYPRDKKGVLDYARLETYYLMNYDKANRLLQNELLDYSVNDYDGLLASGDNFFAWADSNPSRFGDKYEDARYAYARLLDKYGWQAPVVERMMRYFIRTDNLREVLPLRQWFDGSRNRRLSPESKAELGGYLLDKQLEEVKGVPNPYVESIESVRDMLLQAVNEKRELPEPHYHLARYYKNLGNSYEERLTLENAIRAFDLAREESVRRRIYRVDTHYRYANFLINAKEFFPAEEQAVRGIELYEDFVSRNLLSPSVQLGQLYAVRGDLEYFVKTGDMPVALEYYHRSERYGWAPPEIKYRMGAAYYQLEDWQNSLDYLFKASADLPLNRRMLFALGNVTYKRGDYFAAQGYYNRLLDLLENQRVRMPLLLPNDRPEFLELGERLMMARNNAGVTAEALANITGQREYRSQALSLYAESARAWDTITRNPQTMVRSRLADAPGVPGVNQGFLNANNALRPSSNYTPQIFIRIDKDVIEPSHWEELAPFGGLQH